MEKIYCADGVYYSGRLPDVKWEVGKVDNGAQIASDIELIKVTRVGKPKRDAPIYEVYEGNNLAGYFQGDPKEIKAIFSHLQGGQINYSPITIIKISHESAEREKKAFRTKTRELADGWKKLKPLVRKIRSLEDLLEELGYPVEKTYDDTHIR